MAAATQLVPGLGRAIGCDQVRGLNQLLYVTPEGHLMRLDLRTHTHSILGSGYQQLEDVLVSDDGRHAYLTERGGALLRVPLDRADRQHAQLVSSGMTAPHLITVDTTEGAAFIVEYAFPGRLLHIDLDTGRQTVLVRGLEGAIGLMVSPDRRYAYLTEHARLEDGQVCRIDLTTGRRQVMRSDRDDPRHPAWVNAEETTGDEARGETSRPITLMDLLTAGAEHHAA